jgi:glycosyltransferase involved in cell wall biosynthesis
VSPAVLTLYKDHSLRALEDLRRLVRRSAAETVIVHYGGSHLSLKDVLAMRAAGVRRVVVSVHHPNPIQGMRQRAMTALGSRLADAIVVTTEVTKQVLVGAGVPSARIHVVAPSVEAPAKRPVRAEARKRLGIPRDAVVVGTLARLTPEKGVADLIAAVAAVRRSSPAVRLVVGGDGPARAELEALAATRLGDCAQFTRRLPDTADFYAACDIFSLPSHLEGFGLVFLEAAHHGLPTVATAVGGVPLAVKDGLTGLLAPVRDVPAIARALQDLVDDPLLRSRMGAAAKKRVETEFSPAEMCRRYEQILFPAFPRDAADTAPAWIPQPADSAARI